jgi:Flp pilus assembly protein TadD
MTRADETPTNILVSAATLSTELRQACLDEAWARYRRRDFEVSEALSRALVAVDVASPPYRTLLAASLYRLGRAHEAVAEIDEALNHRPDDPDLLELRALLVRN